MAVDNIQLLREALEVSCECVCVCMRVCECVCVYACVCTFACAAHASPPKVMMMSARTNAATVLQIIN